jgi:hypothetical protein
MFEMSLIYLIGIVIPEGLLFAWAFYTLSQTKINIKRYFLCVIINLSLVYIVKLLPIDFGVHTLLLIAANILINIAINKINVIISIVVTISVIIIKFICEVIDFAAISYLLKDNADYIFSNSIFKVLSALPSFILFIFFILLVNFLIKKLESKKIILSKEVKEMYNNN